MDGRVCADRRRKKGMYRKERRRLQRTRDSATTLLVKSGELCVRSALDKHGHYQLGLPLVVDTLHKDVVLCVSEIMRGGIAM